jgi:Asp-tRNA(Asn)/Glu-tRNA(Gln) amidotransferase A subunit family amidase
LLDLEIETGINNDLPLPKFLQQWLDIPVNKRQLTGREVQHRAILAHKPVDAQTELISRHKSIARMREIMQSYDFVLGPATVVNSVRSNNLVEIVSPLSRFYCITKQPTVTVPVGLDSAGMPMAIMIAGDRYNDAGVLQMAQAIESAFPMSPLFY